ncbi:MAG: YraN family protein [Clostridia bacterium]|nr:YraN family protein [Clostridia bacterium]
MNLGSTGSNGESYAAEYLQNKGYEIITRNFSSRFGEIDIVCKKDNFIVFVEVKTRGRKALVSGREAVTTGKQKKIIKTALIYLSAKGITNLQPRFDVVEIMITERVTVEHIINAFDGSVFRGFI